MKVRVGEGSGLEWDLGVGWGCWTRSKKQKNLLSGPEGFSVHLLGPLTGNKEWSFPSGGGGGRGTDTPNCASASAHTDDLVQCRASAGQQAEEPLVIQQMSQAAGMPGI